MNDTAPHPVRMGEFPMAISTVFRSPHWLPVPGVILRAGLGEMSDMLVKGQYVIPQKVLNNGFSFRYSTLNDALVELISKRN